MAVDDEIVAIACDVQPDEATLVPEKRQELTTEGGLDVVANEKAVGPSSNACKGRASSCRSSSIPRSRRSMQQISRQRRGDPDGALLRGEDRGSGARLATSTRWAHADSKGWRSTRSRPHLSNVALIARCRPEEFNIGHSIVVGPCSSAWRRAVRDERSHSLLVSRRDRIIGRDDHAPNCVPCARASHPRECRLAIP